MRNLSFSIIERDGRTASTTVAVEEILLAGYTGRDRAKVLDHIGELEALGVAPPARVPMVYTVEADLATMESSLAVNSEQTSGETEVFWLQAARGLLVGTGSDHTDREQEAIDVAYSKGLCHKVLSRELWRYDDIREHWDRLEVRSWVTEATGRHLYQEGRLDSLLPVEEVCAEIRGMGHELDERIVFGGTLPTIAGLRFGERFEGELLAPVLGRSLRYGYDIRVAQSLGPRGQGRRI